ncbi:hypothetical protein HA402_008216 [Bradysia odoriphaga]|nr:hypothetical protein HA402_008216 [Bradysia odoriphaga]
MQNHSEDRTQTTNGDTRFTDIVAIDPKGKIGYILDPTIRWEKHLNQADEINCFSLKVNKVLHEETSAFQEISILETETHGRALILDGIIQCTERDEFAYQEMISFIPLCCHPNPKKVLIIGGGDGGVAREVVKHPLVEEIHQVEIDDRVIEVAKKYLPFMACGFDSKKVHLTCGDGFEYMKQRKGEFDVIITDSSDPVGPAKSLFQESYFSLMKAALKPNGIVCSQGGTFWTNLDQVKETLDHCRGQFPVASYACASVPSFQYFCVEHNVWEKNNH